MIPKAQPIETESQAALRLDDALIETGLFHIHREVSGVLIQPQAAQLNGPRSSVCRIDRLLLPTPTLTDAGWNAGAVGIEIKSSDMAGDGRVLSQVLDYKRCLWTLPIGGGVRVWLDWIFVFPMPKQHGALASLMAQNRFGTANSNQWTRLHLQCGEATVLRAGHDGDLTVGNLGTTTKVGSR